MDEATSQLQRVRSWLWVFNGFMMVYLCIWLPWALTTWQPNRHSYGLSLPSPGLLVSDHWSPDHVLTMFHMLFFLVPWSLALMSDAPRKRWRAWAHFMVWLVMILFSVAVLGVDIWHLVNANVASADNALNPANDERWCCLYATLNPDACAPISALNPCTIVPPSTSLGWGFTFKWSFGFLIGWLFLLVLDMALSYRSFGRAVLHYESVVMTSGNDLEAQRNSSIELTKNKLPFHILRQQELVAKAAVAAASTTTNAKQKYAGRSNKR